MPAERSVLPDVKDVLIANNNAPKRTSSLSAQSIVLPANDIEDAGPGSVSAEDAPSQTVRLLILGGHALLRDALRASFMKAAGIQVVGEAEDGDAAFHLSCREMPDVILMELPLVCESEIRFFSRIIAQGLPMHMVMLAGSLYQPGVLAAMKLGAKGAIVKDSATTEILREAIHWVAAGGYWVGNENAPTLSHALHVLGVYSEDEPPQWRFGLTARESEILPMLAQGYSNREIAIAFSISVQTVKHHCSHIYDKLGTSNRVELALFAINHQMVDIRFPPAGRRMKVGRSASNSSNTSAALASGQF